jgi:flagellar motor switch protein FliG
LMTVVLGRNEQGRRDPRQQSALERLRSLSSMDSHALCRILSGETPQMVALVLGQLSAQKAAQVLSVWPEEQRADLALLVAKQGQSAPGAVEAVGEALGQHLYRGQDRRRKDAGTGFVVKLLEDMDRSASKRLLDQLRASDQELADQVESQLFTFDNVVQLPDRDLQLVLRALEHATIARALKGMDDEIRQRILTNLSERGQEMLRQEIELLGPVLVSEVETAQKEFARKALELEEAGEIALASGASEYIE